MLFDPVAFMKRHIDRISYIQGIDPVVKADVVKNRTDFYKACGQGIFCNLGQGDVDFPAVRILLDNNFEGWCTVNRLRSIASRHALEDAEANRKYLESIGF